MKQIIGYALLGIGSLIYGYQTPRGRKDLAIGLTALFLIVTGTNLVVN